MKKIKAAIAGSAGFTGGELIRLLLNHPYAELTAALSQSNTGKKIYEVHQDLIGDTDLSFADRIDNDIDVLFLCFAHGKSREFLEKNSVSDKTSIIDLSQDFRMSDKSSVGSLSFVYGLPELNKEQIVTADNIANPGCFATAIQLALLPLAKEKLLQEVHCTAITGSTGAGQSFQPTTQFNWRASNVSAYKTLKHQHLNEIHQSLQQLQGDDKGHVNFIPWRGPFPRGIYASLQSKCNVDLERINNMYNEFYAPHPFTIVSPSPIDMKQVVNTNKCLLYIEKIDDIVVVHSAIDNLLKGASGQAIQNMNLMFQLEETAGLNLKSIVF